jgi:hypothetical protein
MNNIKAPWHWSTDYFNEDNKRCHTLIGTEDNGGIYGILQCEHHNAPQDLKNLKMVKLIERSPEMYIILKRIIDDNKLDDSLSSIAKEIIKDIDEV